MAPLPANSEASERVRNQNRGSVSVSFIFSEADKIIQKIQDEYEKHWKAGDAKGLTSHYHPDAVLIHQGNWAAYRHEGKDSAFN